MSNHVSDTPAPIRLKIEQIDAFCACPDAAARLMQAAALNSEDWWQKLIRRKDPADITGFSRREVPQSEFILDREMRLELTDATGRAKSVSCKIGEADMNGLIPLTFFTPNPVHPGYLSCAHLVWLRPQGVTLLGIEPDLGAPVIPIARTGTAASELALHFVRIRIACPKTQFGFTNWPFALLRKEPS